MSGTPQKMLEHLLETRLGGQVGPNDPFLDDFILTHIVFMPVSLLINELANLYPFHENATIFDQFSVNLIFRHILISANQIELIVDCSLVFL